MFPFHHSGTEVQMPVGAIITYAGNIDAVPSSPPNPHSMHTESAGWMHCDGRSLQTAMCPELFNALGYLYGQSTDSFNIPDLRGVFLRGVGDDSAGTESRNAKNPSGTAASGIGSWQNFAVQTHMHDYTMPDTAVSIPDGNTATIMVVQQTKADQLTGPPTSVPSPPGNVLVSNYETRPVNVFVYFLIKYTTRLAVPEWNIPGFEGAYNRPSFHL